MTKSNVILVNDANPGSYPADLPPEVQVRKCQKRFRKLARQLQRAENQSAAQRCKVERRWFGSHAVRVAATVRANDKLAPYLQIGTKEIFETAKSVRPGKPNDEPATLYGKKKSNGDYRPIWNPKLRRRAIGEAVVPLLEAQLKARPFQYDRRGVHKAIRGVKKAVAAGLEYAQRIDITNHFGSFLIEKLSHQLHLRKGIVEHTVSAKHVPVLGGSSSIPSSIANTARLGLPQGMGLSPLVAFIITSWLDWKVPHGIRLFNYADDFLVMGASKDVVDAAADALCAAIKALPGGHFSGNSLKRTPTSNVCDGFTFLGHMLWTDHGKIIVSPTTTNSNSMLARIMELEDRAWKSPPKWASPEKAMTYGPNALGDAWVFLESWGRAFSECDDTAEELMVDKMVLQEDASCWKGLPSSFLDNYKNAQAVWKWSGSAHDADG